MRDVKLIDVNQLKNELAKYKKGKKLDIRQFNQAARLAWLGKVVLSPLDTDDPECRAWLLHVERPAGLAERLLIVDEDLLSRIHVLDAEQGEYLAQIMERGVAERAAQLQDLNWRDFYFEKFFKPEE
jgi:hypothetical protein